ncbi:MAG: type II toxin-antitoxin system death-on-curing family toxin [Candidatus Aenigmarchaeota archaeon]|nr:type II toxin-antitoxin system death-on-curing family toxin [Candidatus Aenigmarchaeota archaeon]
MVVTKEETELLVQEITKIHNDIIFATQKDLPSGGEPGVRDEGGLHSLAYRILSMIERKADPISLGATILEDIAIRHYFWDGNKRTAYVLAKTLMLQNGLELKPDYEKAVDFVVKVADKKANKAEIRKWIQENFK